VQPVGEVHDEVKAEAQLVELLWNVCNPTPIHTAHRGSNAHT
jgi:hypothetical protein